MPKKEISIQEARNHIAILLGWHRKIVKTMTTLGDCEDLGWAKDGERDRDSFHHPCPNSIEGLMALLPKVSYRLDITIQDTVEAAWRTVGGGMEPYGKAIYASGKDEIEARTRLVLAVLEYEEKCRVKQQNKQKPAPK